MFLLGWERDAIQGQACCVMEAEGIRAPGHAGGLTSPGSSDAPVWDCLRGANSLLFLEEALKGFPG